MPARDVDDAAAPEPAPDATRRLPRLVELLARQTAGRTHRTPEPIEEAVAPEAPEIVRSQTAFRGGIELHATDRTRSRESRVASRGTSMSDKKPFHNPFEALKTLRASMPDPPAPEPAPEPPAAATAMPRVARAVVRLERAGRGGKEVTVIDHLGLKDDDLASWLKALKAALGCGGVVEGDRLVLQGDHRERLRPLLVARGVKRVTVA
jgi:translation initiation factor 1